MTNVRKFVQFHKNVTDQTQPSVSKNIYEIRELTDNNMNINRGLVKW